MAGVWRRLTGKFLRRSFQCAPAAPRLSLLLPPTVEAASLGRRCVWSCHGGKHGWSAATGPVTGCGPGEGRRSLSTGNLRSLLLSSDEGGKPKRKVAPLRNRRFIDRLFVRVKGGDGGSGCTSFQRSRQSRHGVADGGNGGRGGDVWVEATASLWDLASIKQHVNGGRGGNGTSKKKVGQRGEDQVMRVPVGTVVRLIRGEEGFGEGEDESRQASDSLTAITEERWESKRSSLLLDEVGETDDMTGEHHLIALESTDERSRNLLLAGEHHRRKGAHGGHDGQRQFDHCNKVHSVESPHHICSTNEGTPVGHEGSFERSEPGQEWQRYAEGEEETDDEHPWDGRHSEAAYGDGLTTDGHEGKSEVSRRDGEGKPRHLEECDMSEELAAASVEAEDSGEVASHTQTLRNRKKMGVVLGDLTCPGQRIAVCRGGEGGRGNAAMARGRGRRSQADSEEFEKGRKGSSAELILELKTIADVGLVGLPNAGKSTLVGALTLAKPRIGSYAFTTLRPHIGCVEFNDFFSFTIADLPGLIEGAHENRGLGFEFLRHVERTRLLAYVVDLSSGIGDNKGPRPWDQLNCLMEELELFQTGLSKRPSLVVGSKIDEPGAEEALCELRRRASLTVLPVCAVLGEGIEELREELRGLVLSDISTSQETKQQQQIHTSAC
ncbi:hypothetical protein CBR_g39640 [Chara braunii]|uniref:OBG-type G domain-containing protein n=1 Tax=Chara braunii TaxID=69332 RepID=A0A388K1D5_CHABU|nr:hypothetical protein CBR_g39640 [Chara braunii]|eukprot:GBG63856.1 hypothetical protein CBR_g39640 [Chara braunii]